MGLRNDLLMEILKKNNAEIARKKTSGEKLSLGNLFYLICQIGLLLCSMVFGILIIWMLASILK